jgi:tRNA nucleotidyltransferase/poly(A) polymerase/2'-5' RNA ligase
MMWRLARDASKTQCMEAGCKKAPEVECIWADGRGRAWFCQPHFKSWSTESDGMPRDIVKQRKVPAGEVGENYGVYPKTAGSSSARVALAHSLKTAKAEWAVVAANKSQWPVAPLVVVDRMTAMAMQRDHVVLAGFRTKPEAEHFAETIRHLKIEVQRVSDETKVFEGLLLDFSAQAPRLGLRFVDRGRLLELFHKNETVLGNGKTTLHATRHGAANIRASDDEVLSAGHLTESDVRAWAHLDPDVKIAKATGVKTGDGTGVGLFIPLPKNLAKKFPSLGEDDDSPSHVTFLYIGEFPDPEKQALLVEVLRKILRKWWPTCTATLDGLEYFEHHDKDRRVPHVHVEFDRDIAGLRHRVKQELFEAGIEVLDSFPEYKPHVTLAYLPGMDSEWKGPVPKGKWTFDEIEVWGLPKAHKIKIGPSAMDRVAERWFRRRFAAARSALILRGRVASKIVMSAHAKNIALMKWLSDLTRKLGVAEHTYVVGGAVRNFILNVPIKDVDIVIDTVKAKHNSAWLAQQIEHAMKVPANVTTNQYGVAILTVKGDWVLDGENLKGEVIEIADARKESYGGHGGKGYKPHMVEPATIEEDVYRREFSFNTLLWRLMDLVNGPEKAEVIDLTGCGLRDLHEGTLRCPREPDVVFSDDPTRMLRAIKFTGKYGFKIPLDVANSIRHNARKLKQMPWEAVASLLVGEVLSQPAAQRSLVQMRELGLLDAISEMIREQKPFATYMANQLRTNRKVQLLLDLMDLGVPASTPISFLDRGGQDRLRQITVAMPEDVAGRFVDHLIKPPLDNMKVISQLSLDGPDRARIIPLARQLILETPALATDGHRLTDEVIRRWG